ncbi:hypothetical protein [Fuerstiella marisgermanici]|uniref:ABC-2 family transporter protein n=1 Tax=Fuerstiella marisgermanici TaxID=1891926 RepID=A0A1P8WEJ9_9PLAN|nr:hypothetical protein [Fuerstiella marisgermanici]APZ92493.1 hypothetical protein Fuma_02104 [Fuerstiella marisgermanici]
MNALRSFLVLFQDSPTYGRDRANLVSAFTIGVTALLLNGAVLFLVLPLMLDPDDRDFRMLTENVEFGQLLALALLGGAAAFATFLIPLRLMGVFLGPRVGRYFDQIVLSGISPLRFVIGKATSQNLFLCLILFLLQPYLVLSLTLGGVDFGTFLAGLFLVWLYCMALAVVTLWVSLYMNDILAAGLVIGCAAILGGFGFAPLPIQPFIVTPFPALIHPVYRSVPYFQNEITTGFLPVFLSCAAGMTVVICFSVFAIYLGPLYGIIQENSTFGEVVRAGDSKRKRWFRLRLHIQRPSEIAFFYENRSERFRRMEGLIRWGVGLVGMLVLSLGCFAGFSLFIWWMVTNFGGGLASRRFGYGFHVVCQVIHGVGLALAMLVFSHPKNSTFLRIPVVRGKTAEVATLDTVCYVAFAIVSAIAAIYTPQLFEHFAAVPNGFTVFPHGLMGYPQETLDLASISIQSTMVLLVAGFVLYAIHRLACLSTWMRTVGFMASAAVYVAVCCIAPLFIVMSVAQVFEFRQGPWEMPWGPPFMLISPFALILDLFHEFGRQILVGTSTLPFYMAHGVLLVLLLFAIRWHGRRVRRLYQEAT